MNVSNRVILKIFGHLVIVSAISLMLLGQWMTEKTGGSDVSQSETIAEHVGDNLYVE
jgi:hypothetical protein